MNSVEGKQSNVVRLLPTGVEGSQTARDTLGSREKPLVKATQPKVGDTVADADTCLKGDESEPCQ